MAATTRRALRIAGVLWVLAAAAVLAPRAAADPAFTIASPEIAIAGFAAGDSVTITVTAPSDALIERTMLSRLYKLDHLSGAERGTLTGVVSGLHVGANVFELYRAKPVNDRVAQLTIERATTPAMACAALANLTDFPIQPTAISGGTTITLAQLNPATTGANALPEHCQIQGTIQARTGLAGVPGTASFTTAQPYGTRFEVRLPTLWNGRYMLQGGGGTEGSLPSATGAQTGTASFPELRNGFAVASQNGGHTTSQLPATIPATPTSPSILQVNMFFPDALAVRDWAYNSIDVTTQTAKYLINAYYGRGADRSYFVGC